MSETNLRCLHCWKPYAMHEHMQNGNVMCLDIRAAFYCPDSSPEAHVYAAAAELIALEQADSKDRAEYQRAADALSDALRGVRDAARAERAKR